MKFKDYLKNKHKSLILALGTTLPFVSSSILAAGLQAATDEVNEIRVLLYTLLGASSSIYMIVWVVLAMTQRKQWGDVLSATVHVAVAGAALVIVDFAWAIFQ